MVYAMMEFTVTLLQRPPANRKPVAGAELRRRLLALNKPDHPHPLVVGQDCDLEMRWEHADVRRSRFAVSRHSSSSHVRFLLDEQRHELRMNQVDSGSGYFLGLEGWLPRLQGYASLSAGPPSPMLTKDISQMTYRSGWTVRPVMRMRTRTCQRAQGGAARGHGLAKLVDINFYLFTSFRNQ
jgi:hypothetical protein